MVRLIAILAALGVSIYSFVDCLRSDEDEVRGLPRPLWLLVIVFLAPAGGVIYLLFGRQSAQPVQNRSRVTAPDDDPDFLRSLDEHRHPGDDADGR